MTASQEKKIQNLKEEIRKVEEKIDKLFTHRAILAEQIEKIRNQTPKEVVKPSEEQRKAQSERDKQKYAESAQRNRVSCKKMDLGF